MEKTKLMKLLAILIMGVMLAMFSFTTVFAATDDEDDDDDGNFIDLGNSLNTNKDNTNANANANINTNTNINANTNVSANTNTNNTSIYNNTNNLPKTGIEDSIPVALLAVVFGISAVYAYRKIKEYNNV